MHFCHYSSGYFEANSHHSVSACLACFVAIWHILTIDLAFLVHLDLATLNSGVALHLLMQARPAWRVVWHFDILLLSYTYKAHGPPKILLWTPGGPWTPGWESLLYTKTGYYSLLDCFNPDYLNYCGLLSPP